MRFVATLVAALAAAACGGAGDPASPPERAGPAPICDRTWSLRSGPDRVAAGSEGYRSYTARAERGGFITRIEPVVSEGGSVVHHAFVGRGDPDGMGDPARPTLFANGRGTGALALPPGVGLRVDAGESLALGLHVLNPTDAGVTFDAGVDLCLVDEVAAEADVVVFGPEGFVVPPDRAEHEVQGECEVRGERTFFTAWPHMHALGRRIEVDLDGASLLEVGDFRPSEQPLVAIEPARLAHDRQSLRVTCTYVNAGAHPVSWGPLAGDEMCLAFAYYFPAGLSRRWGCAAD